MSAIDAQEKVLTSGVESNEKLTLISLKKLRFKKRVRESGARAKK